MFVIPCSITSFIETLAGLDGLTSLDLTAKENFAAKMARPTDAMRQ